MIQQAYKYVSSNLWHCLTISSWKPLTYWNQLGGDWKRVSCHGNRFLYSHRCVSCRTRTISQPSFNGLHCKLAKIALLIYSNIGLSVCHQSSHLHILPIFQTYISLKPMQKFANGKRHCYFFTEFYVIHSKNQEVKIWA